MSSSDDKKAFEQKQARMRRQLNLNVQRQATQFADADHNANMQLV